MGENKQFKRALISAACTLAFAAAGTSHAANWLMLQGTEDPASAARANVWGFIQAKYEKDFSDPNAAGGFVPPKLLGPELDFRSTAGSTISCCSRWATTASPMAAAPSPE